MRSNIFAWANQHCQVVYTYRNAGTFAKFWLILRACVANCDVPEGFSTAAALITFTSEALYDSLYQLVRCVWGLPPDPRRRRLADVRVPLGMACAAPVSGHGESSFSLEIFIPPRCIPATPIQRPPQSSSTPRMTPQIDLMDNNERRRADRVQQSSRIDPAPNAGGNETFCSEVTSPLRQPHWVSSSQSYSLAVSGGRAEQSWTSTTDSLSSVARNEAILTPVFVCDEAMTGSESAICQLLRSSRYRTPPSMRAVYL